MDGRMTHLGGVKNFLDLGESEIIATFLCEILGLLLHQDLNIA
jgi:hypothetical protein